MGKSTKKQVPSKSVASLASPLALVRPSSLGEMIHSAVREAIQQAVEAELEAALGAPWYERSGERRGYRNGHRERTLSGPTGPAAFRQPRGILFERTARAARSGSPSSCPATSGAWTR